MFTDFVKSELTEDQLLPTLRQLLPVLLNILGDAEVLVQTRFPLFDNNSSVMISDTRL